MVLAVLAHDAQKVLVGQDRRRGQHGTGDGGFIVGQPTDQVVRRVRRRGEACRQFGADGGLHVGRQPGQDGAVQGVFGRSAGRPAEEMLGQLAQQGAPFFAGALFGQPDQLGKAGEADALIGGAGHWWSPSEAAGAGLTRPWLSRIRVGPWSGWARS